MIMLISTFLCSCSNDNINIEISTSGCYKTCPIIDLKIENNKALFKFIKFNKKEGLYEYKLSSKEKENIKFLLKKINLNELQDEYTSNRVDMQVYNILIYNNNVKKSIYFYENNAPKELDSLVKTLIGLRDREMIKSNDDFNVETRAVFPVMNTPSIPPPPLQNENEFKDHL